MLEMKRAVAESINNPAVKTPETPRHKREPSCDSLTSLASGGSDAASEGNVAEEVSPAGTTSMMIYLV